MSTTSARFSVFLAFCLAVACAGGAVPKAAAMSAASQAERPKTAPSIDPCSLLTASLEQSKALVAKALPRLP